MHSHASNTQLVSLRTSHTYVHTQTHQVQQQDDNILHHHTIRTYSRNSLRQTRRDPQNEFLLSDIFLIRICLLCVQYHSKPYNAQKLVCVKQIFVLRVFVLTRFYSMYILYTLEYVRTYVCTKNTNEHTHVYVDVHAA